MTDLLDARFAEGRLAFTLDARVYRLTAMKKAAYRFADRFTASFQPGASDEIRVELAFKSGTEERVARDALPTFMRELLDQDLREQISEETAPLRTLILAQAFSRTDLIRRE